MPCVVLKHDGPSSPLSLWHCSDPRTLTSSLSSAEVPIYGACPVLSNVELCFFILSRQRSMSSGILNQEDSLRFSKNLYSVDFVCCHLPKFQGNISQIIGG